MSKFIFWLPLHLLNAYTALLAPRWVVKKTYRPSSEAIRKEEETIRNKIRLADYHAKKFLTKNQD